MPFDKSQAPHQALRAIVAERTRPLLAWVGAGLSAAAGLPTWAGLREHLVEALENKAQTFQGDDVKRYRAAAELARHEPNMWRAFEILQTNLNVTSFRDEVREALKAAATAPIPKAYEQLWALRVRGIFNLNLDRLATRAFINAASSDDIVTHVGTRVAQLQQILTEPPRFIGYLHGSVEETESWVFTQSQLSSLLANEAYKSLIRTALTMHTVIFVGMTIDDFAVGGHLEALARLGIETPTHYWLTDRLDPQTDFWAEQAGVRVIRYSSADGDHSAVHEFLDDLLNATPIEPAPSPPVALARDAETTDTALPPVEELVTWDAERIREVLNAHASALLSQPAPSAVEAYEAFSDEYDQAIYRAWYTRPKPGSDRLLGYSLERDVARGAFGRVYEATAPHGEKVAVKILLEEIRNDTDLLQSFRRGVNSMRILSDRGVDGMVDYLEASEIPAFVVMEWMDGPNLSDAKAAGYIDDWSTIVRIACELTRVIRTAHSLPERVLHRDIRPSNVMLRDYFQDPDRAPVVVLDFDLSWHRDAYEVSVLHSTAAGYLAPEQIRRDTHASTRHAAVDSFGLGMTFLFLCTGVDPLPDQHRHEHWEQHVIASCSRIRDAEWRSAPARFARLILMATQDRQSARWDLSEIGGELDRLRGALREPARVSTPDLLAEEIAAHTDVMTGYTWDIGRMRAMTQLPTGLQCDLRADLQNRRIEVSLEWNATGVEDRSGLYKYVAQGARSAEARLKSAGWRRVTNATSPTDVHITGEMSASDVRGRAEDVAVGIDRAVENLRFGS